MPGEESKKCSACGEVKPFSAFYFEKGRPRGKCKECHKAVAYRRRQQDPEGFRAYQRTFYADRPEQRAKRAEYLRQWREAKGEEYNAERRAARAADPEKFRKQKREWWARNAERIAENRRAWWAEHSEEARAARREDRKRNPQKYRRYDLTKRRRHGPKIRSRNRKWHRDNPEAAARLRAKRRARMASVPHESYTRLEIWTRDGGECQGCRVKLPYKKGAFQIDHIVPISKGGPDTPANVQVLCAGCNREKWARTDWLPPRPTLF